MSTRKKSDYLRRSKAYILLFALLPLFMMKTFHHHADFAVVQNYNTIINGQTTLVSAEEDCAICDMLLTFFTLEKELFLSISTLILSLEFTISLDEIHSDTPTSFFLRAPPLLSLLFNKSALISCS